MKILFNAFLFAFCYLPTLGLLALFGVDAGSLGTLALGMLIGVGLLLGLLALVMMRRRRPPADPASRAYRRFCGRLARAGITRRAAEGPLDFATRAITIRPQLRESVERITALYVAARYADDHGALLDFKRAVRAFRPL